MDKERTAAGVGDSGDNVAGHQLRLSQAWCQATPEPETPSEVTRTGPLLKVPFLD